MTDPQVDRLEKDIDRYNEPLADLTSFILPGGSAAAAYLHLARTVVRRAERETITLSRVEKVNPAAIKVSEPAVGPVVRAVPPLQWPGQERCSLGARRKTLETDHDRRKPPVIAPDFSSPVVTEAELAVEPTSLMLVSIGIFAVTVLAAMVLQILAFRHKRERRQRLHAEGFFVQETKSSSTPKRAALHQHAEEAGDDLHRGHHPAVSAGSLRYLAQRPPCWSRPCSISSPRPRAGRGKAAICARASRLRPARPSKSGLAPHLENSRRAVLTACAYCARRGHAVVLGSGHASTCRCGSFPAVSSG